MRRKVDGSPKQIIVRDLWKAQHFGRHYPGCYALVAMPTAGDDRTRVVITE